MLLGKNINKNVAWEKCKQNVAWEKSICDLMNIKLSANLSFTDFIRLKPSQNLSWSVSLMKLVRLTFCLFRTFRATQVLHSRVVAATFFDHVSRSRMWRDGLMVSPIISAYNSSVNNKLFSWICFCFCVCLYILFQPLNLYANLSYIAGNGVFFNSFRIQFVNVFLQKSSWHVTGYGP